MKTREQMVEAAEAYGSRAVPTSLDYFVTPGQYNFVIELTEFLADFALEQIEEAIAAIVAAIEAKLIKSSLPDAYEEGFDDGLAKAIEIVKGGDDVEK